MTNHFFMLQPIIVKSSIDGRTQYVSIVQFDCDDIIYIELTLRFQFIYQIIIAQSDYCTFANDNIL